MNIGVVYQCGPKPVATYKALEQLRKFYPEIAISVTEDGTDNLKWICDKFDCEYKRIEKTGQDDGLTGKLFAKSGGQLEWLSRIYQSCLSHLKNCDWIIHYEDDVWCRKRFDDEPEFDISGALGPLYATGLYEYLKHKHGVTDDSRGVWSPDGSLENYGACGGTIFNKEKFMFIYENLEEIPWQIINEMDNRPLEWCDAALSFVFQFNNFSSGRWSNWGTYHSKRGNHWDKTGWTTPMSEQDDVAFIHGFKHFYNYSIEELDLAIDKEV